MGTTGALDCLVTSSTHSVLRDEVAARTTPHEVTPLGGPLDGRVGVLSLPESRLVFVRYGGDVIVEAPATGSRIVATIPLGPMDVSVGANPNTQTFQSGFLLSRTESTLMHPDPWAGSLVVASEEARLAVHRRVVLGPEVDTHIEHGHMRGLGQSTLLENACRHAWTVTSTLPSGIPHETLTDFFAAIEDHILTALVLAWTHEEVHGDTSGDSRVDLLLDWLRENHGVRVTVTDMAAAVGLSVRQLQASVQRTLGLSPSALLRDVRLVAAHHALRDSDPHATTVAAIAHENGIVHLGRFSTSYRSRFGESPSITLHRHKNQNRHGAH
ncbi:MAG: AraC family transcriptional regulator [Candidatus Nanopelagicales bacterium]|jgi:AraC-like DNA-binding protein|nr:AraC family transcriptional regulator [Candidatus Nanopelagicales bacterium]